MRYMSLMRFHAMGSWVGARPMTPTIIRSVTALRRETVSTPTLLLLRWLWIKHLLSVAWWVCRLVKRVRSWLVPLYRWLISSITTTTTSSSIISSASAACSPAIVASSALTKIGKTAWWIVTVHWRMLHKIALRWRRCVRWRRCNHVCVLEC